MYDPALSHTLDKLKGAAGLLDDREGELRGRVSQAWRELMWLRSRDLPIGPWRDDFLAMNLRLTGRPDPRPRAVDRLSDDEVAQVASEIRSLYGRLNGVA